MQNEVRYVPKSIPELLDMLGFIMLKSPRFEDVMFPGRNLESVFIQLNDGLRAVRSKLGEKRYPALSELAHRMHTHFEADPEDNNGEAKAGRALLHEMRVLLQKR